MAHHLGSDGHSESLDDPKFGAIFGQEKRSDFLIGSRAGIVELKTFNGDPTNRVEAMLKKRMSEPGAPYVIGSLGFEPIFRDMDDGDELSKKVIDLSTRAARRHLKDANKQILSTKQTLDIPKSAGTLILLNDNQPMIDIGAITFALKQLLENDLSAFSEVKFILICVECHQIKLGNGELGYPMVGMFRSNICDEYLSLMGQLAGAWSARHGSIAQRIDHRGQWEAMAPVYPEGAPVLNLY